MREITGMIENLWPIVLIVVGALLAIFRGIFGIGIQTGRAQWIYDIFGLKGAKIFAFVSGIMIVIFGIIWLIFPDFGTK